MQFWTRNTEISGNTTYRATCLSADRVRDQHPKRPSATILYPTSHVAAREARIEVADPVQGKRIGTVHLRPVNLERLDCLVNDLSANGRRTREEYAATLALSNNWPPGCPSTRRREQSQNPDEGSRGLATFIPEAITPERSPPINGRVITGYPSLLLLVAAPASLGNLSAE